MTSNFQRLATLLIFASRAVFVDGTTLLCDGASPCVLPQAQTCPEFIAMNRFLGTCCSLRSDTNTGACIVTVSNGHCFWEPKNHECPGGTVGCSPDGTQYLSTSLEACPPSEFEVDIFNPEFLPPVTPTPPPSTAAPIVITNAPTPAPTSAPSPRPTVRITDAPVEVIVPPAPTPAPIPPPTPQSVPGNGGGGGISAGGTGGGGGGGGGGSQLTQYCLGPGPCAIYHPVLCSDFIQENRFVGSCCSLNDDIATGGCILLISNGHCFWEPRDGSCDPIVGCPFGAGVFYESQSSVSCPLSRYDPFNPDSESNQVTNGGVPSFVRDNTMKEDGGLSRKAIIWITVVVIFVFLKVLICAYKCHADRINMEAEDEEQNAIAGAADAADLEVSKGEAS